MNLTEAIERRHSIRRFTADPVPHEDIEKMVCAASLAPSGGNYQPWHFLAIRNLDCRDGMVRIIHDECIAFFRRFYKEVPKRYILPSLVFSTAPLVFVVLVTPFPLEKDTCFSSFRKQKDLCGRNIDRYGGFVSVQSVAAAIENLLLTACDLGYGSCWLRVPYYAKDHVEEFLEVEKPWEMLALIPVGIPDQNPLRPSRKPVEKILTYID
ncbi:MAG: nitroreductase family protein [Theionarchaea archaeon]|nr:nitroreductase family protein [Theionarchaea archaeon]